MTGYDYEGKGAADFKAGRRDDRLYNQTDLAGPGVSYRRGWQAARRAAADNAPVQPIAAPVKQEKPRPATTPAPEPEKKPRAKKPEQIDLF